MKFGFIFHSGVGNAVLSTPMLKALRSMYPKAEIIVFTWERCAEVFRNLSCVDKVALKLDQVNDVDYLLMSPNGVMCLLEKSKKIKRVIQIKRPNWEKHESEYYMDLIREFGYNGSTPSPEITPEGQAPQEKYAVMSLGFIEGIEWHLKQINDNDEWVAVCNYLIDEGHRIFFLGVQKDYEIAQDIILQLPQGKTVNACGLTSLKQATAIINSANMFVGLDCGLAHIASCFQIPSTCVWTFTDLIKNKPLNPNLEIVEIECVKKHNCQYGGWKSCENKFCRNITSDMIINGIKKVEKKFFNGTV